MLVCRGGRWVGGRGGFPHILTGWRDYNMRYDIPATSSANSEGDIVEGDARFPRAYRKYLPMSYAESAI